MVNVIISPENKCKFKSKNAILKLKKFLKEHEDIGLVSSIDFLKDGYQFILSQEGYDITVNIKDEEHIWGNQQQHVDKDMIQPPHHGMTDRERLRKKLKELHTKRSGRDFRDLKSMKKTVDKDIFERYAWLKQNVPGVPIPKPTEILDDPEKHKEQIELFGSGLMQISGNKKVDQYIAEYFGIIAKKIGFDVLTKEQIQERMKPPQPPAPPQEFDLPSNINLSNYVDSDTESESDDDVKENCCKDKDCSEDEYVSV
jgi:hypothetical protein